MLGLEGFGGRGQGLGFIRLRVECLALIEFEGRGPQRLKETRCWGLGLHSLGLRM